MWAELCSAGRDFRCQDPVQVGLPAIRLRLYVNQPVVLHVCDSGSDEPVAASCLLGKSALTGPAAALIVGMVGEGEVDEQRCAAVGTVLPYP